MEKGKGTNPMKEDVFARIESADGDVTISGVSAASLAKECGTPLYIFDETGLEQTMQAYVNDFKSDEFETRVVFASKAFSNKAVLKLCAENGLYIDSVSLGEIYTAKSAGIDLSTIYFHGNNKTKKELRAALEWGVGTLILDGLEEAQTLVSIASEYPERNMRVLLRINPIVEAATHHHIQTAAPDSKFGIPITMEERIVETIRTVQQAENLHFAGLHAHIGSQIFELEPYAKEIEEFAEFMVVLNDRYGIAIEEIDLGGGFGVWYSEADTPNPIAKTCAFLIDACQKTFTRCGFMPERVTIEPGRSIVAESGYLLYTITRIKQGLKNRFYLVDGGMSDLIRPALYDARYTASVVGAPEDAPTSLVTVAGKCCESGDIVIRDIELPEAKEDDLLLIYTAGAYGISMASNYNKQPFPGVVFVKDGNWRYVLKPQSLEEMIAHECE